MMETPITPDDPDIPDSPPPPGNGEPEIEDQPLGVPDSAPAITRTALSAARPRTAPVQAVRRRLQRRPRRWSVLA
jgi:hypothetical protein